MPSPLDLADLPFLREALLELVLLAVTGGVLGAWIVLRRLAFFSHAAGSATFPGLVAADATGVSPDDRRRSRWRSDTRGRSERGGATRDHGEATALLLVAALATGVILASDVFESGAVVDRLLFGTLLGLDTADLVLSAAGCRIGRGRRAGARPHVVGRRLRPGRRARPRAADRARGPAPPRARGGGGGGRHPGGGRPARDRDLRAPRRGGTHAHREHPRARGLRARHCARRGRGRPLPGVLARRARRVRRWPCSGQRCAWCLRRATRRSAA